MKLRFWRRDQEKETPIGEQRAGQPPAEEKMEITEKERKDAKMDEAFLACLSAPSREKYVTLDFKLPLAHLLAQSHSLQTRRHRLHLMIPNEHP